MELNLPDCCDLIDNYIENDGSCYHPGPSLLGSAQFLWLFESVNFWTTSCLTFFLALNCVYSSRIHCTENV
jgi:hypothetical protein